MPTNTPRKSARKRKKPERYSPNNASKDLMDDLKAASDFPRPKIKSTKEKTGEKGRGKKGKKEKKKRENIKVMKRLKIASVEPSRLAAKKQLQGNSISSADISTHQGDSTGTNNNKRNKEIPPGMMRMMRILLIIILKKLNVVKNSIQQYPNI